MIERLRDGEIAGWIADAQSSEEQDAWIELIE